MSVAAAEIIVATLEWHLGCGALFAALFLWRWVGILDPAAGQGTLGFRILVFPGVAMLWPLFVWRLVRGATMPPEEWTAHRAAAGTDGRPRRVEVIR